MRRIDPAGIPAKVVLEKERTEAAGEVKQALCSIQDAVVCLQNLQDFEAPLSADPNDWQEALKKADKRKDEALKAIASNMMLTQENKVELAGEWKEWHKKAATACNTVVKQVTKYAGCKFAFCSSVQNIVPTIPTMEVAEAEAMRDVPPEARDHALLLAIVWDAINGLRKWEQEHDVKKIRLEELLSLDETQLAEAWVNGNIHYPSYRDFDKALELRNKSVREYVESTFI